MAINKVQLPDGTEVVIDEWLHYPLFSTIQIGSDGTNGDSTNLRAFSYVQGMRVPSTAGVTPGGNRLADARDTNMVKRGGLNYDEAFILYAITYEAFALTPSTTTVEELSQLNAPAPVLTAENVKRLQRDLLIELIVGAQQQKPQLRAPFSFIGQSAGTKSFASTGSVGLSVAFSQGTGGSIDARNQRRLELPIYIESQQVAFMKVSSPIGTIAGLDQQVRLRWYWDGLKRRPVA